MSDSSNILPIQINLRSYIGTNGTALAVPSRLVTILCGSSDRGETRKALLMKQHVVAKTNTNATIIDLWHLHGFFACTPSSISSTFSYSSSGISCNSQGVLSTILYTCSLRWFDDHDANSVNTWNDNQDYSHATEHSNSGASEAILACATSQTRQICISSGIVVDVPFFLRERGRHHWIQHSLQYSKHPLFQSEIAQASNSRPYGYGRHTLIDEHYDIQCVRFIKIAFFFDCLQVDINLPPKSELFLYCTLTMLTGYISQFECWKNDP
jgi:hypothetical protein